MIPKVIHYCWLSDQPFPAKIQRCIDSWRKTHPDYEIKRWSTKNFDIDAVPYVREAFDARKWAFAADYIRMYALYTEGGIYLDSDVMLLKKFDCFLDNSFFSSMEYHPTQVERAGTMAHLDADGHRTDDAFIEGIQIQAAVMGAEAGCPFVKEVLDWYADKHFRKADGTLMTDVLALHLCPRGRKARLHLQGHRPAVARAHPHLSFGNLRWQQARSDPAQLRHPLLCPQLAPHGEGKSPQVLQKNHWTVIENEIFICQ